MLSLTDIYIGIQCRIGSKRLPGKVLKKVQGKELIVHLYERLAEAGYDQEKIYFLIPDSRQDDRLADFLDLRNYNFLRGSECDVLARYRNFAEKLHESQSIVRLTADNPFIDTRVIEYAIKDHLYNDADFTSTRIVYEDNKVKRLVPKGNSVDIFKAWLIRKELTGLTSFDREHVIPALYRSTTVNLISEMNFQFSVKESISVDTEEDFKMLMMKSYVS